MLKGCQRESDEFTERFLDEDGTYPASRSGYLFRLRLTLVLHRLGQGRTVGNRGVGAYHVAALRVAPRGAARRNFTRRLLRPRAVGAHPVSHAIHRRLCRADDEAA